MPRPSDTWADELDPADFGVARIYMPCAAELREDDGPHGFRRRLVGQAAVFGPEADLGSHVERLAPGFLDDALDAGENVRSLVNHDPNRLLGTTAAGTLSLRADRSALHFAVNLPDTTYARDLAELVRRGDLTGASFAFIPGEETYDRNAGGRHRVTHTRARRLLDVSPVTFPAYPDAGGLALRHLEHVERSFGDSYPAGGRRDQLIRLRAAARSHQEGTPHGHR